MLSSSLHLLTSSWVFCYQNAVAFFFFFNVSGKSRLLDDALKLAGCCELSMTPNLGVSCRLCIVAGGDVKRQYFYQCLT